jgi:hypothetical protein|tara:strand:- start:233 stop:415 length:183 start_codon:yes stop_codon:yes gene_type:complete
MKEETRKILEEMGVGIWPADDPIYTGVKPDSSKQEALNDPETEGEEFMRLFLYGRGDRIS